MSESTPQTVQSRFDEIPIHFVKGSGFKVTHANGVWFGADPQGNLHLTFYNERTPIPKKVVLKIDHAGQTIGEDESKREGKEGIVREMEIDIVMSVIAANNFYEMLGQNLKIAIKNLEASKSAPTEE